MTEGTVAKYATVQDEGGRHVSRDLEFYNLDAFMTLNERDILTSAGTVSHEMARELAETEYDKFHARRIAESKTALSDFDKIVKRLSPTKKGIRK